MTFNFIHTFSDLILTTGTLGRYGYPKFEIQETKDQRVIFSRFTACKA